MSIYTGDIQILYIKIDDEFVPVGCLTTNSFNESLSTINASKRQKDGWMSSRGSQQGYNISFVGTLSNSYALSKLLFFKREKIRVQWRIDYFTNLETGFGYIMDLQESAPMEEFISFSGSIEGYGEPFTYDNDLYLNYDLNFDI